MECKKVKLIVNLIIVCILTGCNSNKVQNVKDFDFSYIECTGMSFSDMCDALNIQESQLETAEYDEWTYFLKEKVTFCDVEFTGYFGFDRREEILCGGGYYCNIDDSGEELKNLVHALLVKMENIFGDPIENENNSIYGVEDFTHDKDTLLVESWNVPGKNDARISLQLWLLDSGDPNQIRIEHRIQSLPPSLQKNK